MQQFDGSLLVITDPAETVVTEFLHQCLHGSGVGERRDPQFVSKDNTYVSAACMPGWN